MHPGLRIFLGRARFISPMDREDIPLATMGLPGCPYRITSCGHTCGLILFVDGDNTAIHKIYNSSLQHTDPKTIHHTPSQLYN